MGARDHYIDVGPSSLRQVNHSLSDPKYAGARVSRKDLVSTDTEDEGVESDEQSGGDSHSDEEDMNDGVGATQSEEPSAVTHQFSSHFSPAGHVHDGSAQQDQGVSSDLASKLLATREQDRKKGKAVARQITVWDTLLDARIRLQKAATAMHHLNFVEPPGMLRERESVHTATNDVLDEAVVLSQDLFTLHESLFRADASPTHVPRKRVKLSHASQSERAATLLSLSAAASELEADYHPYLVQVLAKWSAKVQAVAPNVLLPVNRGSFKDAFTGKTGRPGVVDVISDTLRADADKLLLRTRTSRFAEGVDVECPLEDVEVFDDMDFYQQLLRDIIEARGSGLNDADAEPEWIRRQKANKAKRKKTVDVKASKGRKLRYQVHEKLQNFMVPITVSKGAWHDEQVDELFSSLLGSTL